MGTGIAEELKPHKALLVELGSKFLADGKINYQAALAKHPGWASTLGITAKGGQRWQIQHALSALRNEGLVPRTERANPFAKAKANGHGAARLIENQTKGNGHAGRPRSDDPLSMRERELEYKRAYSAKYRLRAKRLRKAAARAVAAGIYVDKKEAAGPAPAPVPVMQFRFCPCCGSDIGTMMMAANAMNQVPRA